FIKELKNLKILRYFKKRTAIVFTECDVQQPEATFRNDVPFSACHHCTDEYKKFVGCYPEIKKIRTKKIEGLIDIILNDRAIDKVLERESHHINQPINLSDFPEV